MSRRNNRKVEPVEEKLTLDESSFPALGSTVKTTKPVWGKKFSELASEWKTQEEESKILDSPKKDDRDIVLPRFNPTHKFVEQETAVPEPQEEESDWTTVDRTAKKLAQLARKQQRIDEKMRRMDEGEDVESDKSEPEDTCWNDGPAAHETCWDERP